MGCKLPHKRGMPTASVQSLAAIKARIAAALAASGRKPGEVTLIAVSKTFAADAIRPVLEADQVDFGENRVQEAKGKWPQLKQLFPATRLHLIGPLQSNKAADAVKLFDAIHSLDRPSLAAALASEFTRQKRKPDLFIQVNTGDESQKAGVSVVAVDDFIAAVREQHGLSPIGLMCIPPVDEPPEKHFELLAAIAARNSLPCLSMGMSGDFETAIRCGATHVRIGSSIFGAR